MKNKYFFPLLALLLSAVVLAWVTLPRTALLENDLDGGPDSFSIYIDDENVPLVQPPEGEIEDDPFAQFTEDQLAVMNEVLELVNDARAEAGLDPLELEPVLCGAAQTRAVECVSSFSHTRPSGARYKTAITEAGLSASYTGENIATGHTTAKQVVAAWMKSEGHKANILGEHYTKLGVGFEANTGSQYKGYAWAQLFMSDPK